ncbi:efflux RND transporter periplasmic adaptor subunit [Celeribacter sp.]|uniref:efflux RND transporter periplasmic adaptor subunit n=1 Tax=Celeribacter sp. TaxID=1890673 RepID=UPI003A8E4A3C
MRLLMIVAMIGLWPLTSMADTVITPSTVTEWKAVYGRIEARDLVPARARIGGTLVELAVSEGDLVEAGQVLAQVYDQKLDFQLNAIDAQISALKTQLDNAQAELTRGENLLERGVTTAQRLDALRTQVGVLEGQIAATGAERSVIEQQAAEGAVLAPATGRVLDVPVTKVAVVMPGEAVASIGGGGFYLRLAIPERHASALVEGASIVIDSADQPASGTLARIYPQIENGRVIADVEVDGLSSAFVDARVLVRIPVGNRTAITVSASSLITRSGMDFVPVRDGDDVVLRAVIPGEVHGEMVEIVTGLNAGDVIVPADGECCNE